MKKYKVFITSMILMLMFSAFNFVNAAVVENQIDTAKTLLETNKIVLNNNFVKGNYNILSGEIGNTSGVERQGLIKEVADDETGTIGLRSYEMYYVNSPNVSVTRRYKNIGTLDDNKSPYYGRTIGADMTISDLKMGNGSKNYDHSVSGNPDSGIGFNRYYLGFILFEGRTNGYGDIQRGSVAKITVRFFVADVNGNPIEYNPDGTVKYLKVSSAYMGIGGYGSEKLISNGSASNVLGAPQWEWTSFDNTVSGNINGYCDPICNMDLYGAGYTGTATDYDNTTKNYGWGVAPANSFTNMATANVTGRQVVSNGGNRFALDAMEVMGVEYARAIGNYDAYRKTIRKGYYMFEMQKANVNGNEISQFSFEFGKSFGTVELGLRPILLANYFPGEPVKSVDKAVAHENETLKYTITQKVGFMQKNATNQQQFDSANTIDAYSTMSIIDTLPNEVTYAGNLVVKRKDNGAVLSNGRDYTVTPSGNTITITFTNDFLTNRMAYVGEDYEISFNATVKDLTYAQAQQNANGNYTIYTANNTARTIINGTTAESNRVTTQIVFDILTKAQRASISQMITEIRGGESGKQVVFTPDPGYYIDQVEWQSQTLRYANSTAELVNVTDIPAIGKVTIPERKNGTSYEFAQTMSNSEGNTLNYDPYGTTTFTFNNVDNNHFVKVVAKPMKMVIQISKEDIETGKIKQGDARFEGAEYSIYTDYDTTTEALSGFVEKVILDEDGNGQSSELSLEKSNAGIPYGEYFVKETKAPEGYLIDETVYQVTKTATEQAADRQKVSYKSVTSKESVKRNSIEITKYLEETDSTDKQKLSGSVFSATRTSDPTKVYYSTVTDENGYCIISDLPYGRYRIQETTVPDHAYNGEFYVEDSDARVTTFDHYIELDETERDAYKYNITDVAKKMQITIYKEDFETGTTTQGDATLAGARYTLFRDPECTDAVETVTIAKNEDGTWSAKSGWYLVGTYYVKETQAPEGYLIDEKVYTVSQDPASQTVERTLHEILSKDEVMKGDIHVIKFLNQPNTTDEDPAQGCKLYLTLDSSKEKAEEKVYEATIDKYGYCEWIDIPYGWYTITESEEAREKGFKLMDPEPLYVKNDNQQLYRIVGENPIETLVKVIKEDKETGLTIERANTRYKIWNYQTNSYVTQIAESGEIDEFKTNDLGYFITPQKLLVGKYKLVEIDPPENYHNEDMDFEVEDGTYENVESVPMVVVYQQDISQKAKIEVNKKAEVLVGTRQSTDPDTGLEVLTPIYETRGLEGVTYRVTAVEEIRTADGTLRMGKGESIDILTDENGHAVTPDLYLGTYTLQEVNTVTGYRLNDKVETITLDYRTEGRDEEGRLKVSRDYTVSTEFTNTRIPYELSFEKKFGTTIFNNVDEDAKNRVRFGLYAAENISRNNSSQTIIPKDSLLEVLKVVDGNVAASVDLPVGEYYVKEIETNIPYEIDENKYEFTFRPAITTDLEHLKINNGRALVNEPVTGEVNFLKITRKVYNANKEAIDRIVQGKNVAKFRELAQEYGIEGSIYEVFFKNNNGEYVKLQTLNETTNEWEDVVFESGTNGTDFKSLPYDTYYFKEIQAPVDHEIDPNYIEVKVNNEINIAVVNDPKIQGKVTVIHKDINTDEEIYDREKLEDDIGEPYTSSEKSKEINESLDEEDLGEYFLVEEKYPENAEGFFDKEEQTVTYYYDYVQTKGKVTVYHLDVDTGEEIYTRFVYIGKLEDPYSTEPKTEEINIYYDGQYYYELVEEEYPENAEGFFDKEEQIVKYYYKRFEIPETSDLNVYAISAIALASVIGIAFITAKKKSLN